MAGVASGLALATTLMAMQVADSMSSRSCPYREARLISTADRGEHGFLGITYTVTAKSRSTGSYAEIDRVLPDTPAAAVGLRQGDQVLSVNNMRVTTTAEFFERIFNMRPGATPSLVVNRGGDLITVRPTLVAWPTVVID